VDGAGAFDPSGDRDVAEFARTLEGRWGAFDMRIGSGDEMFAWEHTRVRSAGAAAVAYLFTGHQIFRTVEDVVAWRFGDFSRVGTVLDFASGWGRLTRFLVRAIPPERMVVSDIEASAVRFQEDAFGVGGIVSTTDPAAFPLPDRFDLIFVSSLFSHLPQERFEGWLQALFQRLRPSGVLAFSVNGMDRMQDAAVDASSGFVFQAESETRRLSGSEYGTAYVSEMRVRELAGRASGGEGRIWAAPRGLAGWQDLYLLVRDPSRGVSQPTFPRAPRGAMERARVADGRVSAEGWASGDEGEALPVVRLILRGRPWPVLRDAASPSVASWKLEFPVDAIGPDELVRIEAESERGRRLLLFVGSLRPYLPAGAV
jgi:SAM-dependent methyltransferase